MGEGDRTRVPGVEVEAEALDLGGTFPKPLLERRKERSPKPLAPPLGMNHPHAVSHSAVVHPNRQVERRMTE